MSEQVDQLNSEIAAAKSAEISLATRVQAQIDALNATIADLKAHPAAPDLTQQLTDLQGVVDGLNGLLAPAAPAAANATDAAAGQ